MLRGILKISLICLAGFSCDTVSSSRFEVVDLENDQISDREKIILFEASTDRLAGPAHAAIAKLYANDGDYRSALGAIHEAIILEPMNSFYHTLKSNYAYETGDISSAYREALTAYQLGSKSLQQSLILAKMGVALSEYSIVDNIIDSLVLVYPNNPEVVYMAARKFEKSGKTGQAIDQYQKGIQLDPDMEDNYFYLARLYLSQGNALSALKTLESKEIPVIEKRSAMLKAEAFQQISEVDSASKYYSFLVQEEKDSLVYNRLITLYDSAARRDALTGTITLAADSFPESRYFLKTAGEHYDKRYKYDEALVYYQRLQKLDTLDTLVAEEISILQRKIAYLQRKRQEETKQLNEFPIRKLTLPALDSINY